MVCAVYPVSQVARVGLEQLEPIVVLQEHRVPQELQVQQEVLMDKLDHKETQDLLDFQVQWVLLDKVFQDHLVQLDQLVA